jgi:hypothetical protein
VETAAAMQQNEPSFDRSGQREPEHQASVVVLAEHCRELALYNDRNYQTDCSCRAAGWGPTLDNFRLEKLPIPQAGPGEMLLRTLWLSLDPTCVAG